MPGGDGTGPVGSGPMTGRAAGLCAGYDIPGFANSRYGYGFGAGWGRGGGGGRGRRNRFFTAGQTGWQPMVRPAQGYVAPFQAAPFPPAATQEQQIEALKNQAKYFKDVLEDISKRIEELEA